MRDQRWQINTEFSPVLRSLLDLDPTFTGISNKISKIEGIWPLVSGHFAHLLARLIPPLYFMFLAGGRLSDALKQTTRHEHHGVLRSGELLLLAAVRPPYS